jgi:uncharacterized membrane protein
MQPHYIAGLVAIGLSIPLVLGKVPPNRWYGFRTPKTLSDERVWYPANRAGGWAMLAAGFAIIAITEAIGYFSPWVLLGSIGLAILYSVWFVQRL